MVRKLRRDIVRKISRKWEKTIAWTANSIFIFITGVTFFFGYLGNVKVLVDLAGVQEKVYEVSKYFYKVKPELVGATLNMDEVAKLLQLFLKYYSVFLLVILLLALTATIKIDKRYMSIPLFVTAAIAIFGASLSSLWFISLAYIVVALQLLLRRTRAINLFFKLFKRKTK